MRRKAVLILAWVLVLAVCVTIFWFSGTSADESSAQSGFLRALLTRLFGVGFTEFFIRKVAHMMEFAALGFLSTFAFCYTFQSIKRFYCGIAFSLLYACSDEFHQRFVPGRAGKPMDVLIDLAGILLGVIVLGLCYFVYKIIKKRGKKNVQKLQGD